MAYKKCLIQKKNVSFQKTYLLKEILVQFYCAGLINVKNDFIFYIF